MRFSLILLAGLCFAQNGVAAEAAPREVPNVIVIVADDLGYADVGFQGCQDIPTPHLNALAKSGIVCTNGYVSHPFCSPTRAGLLTGRYQQRFGHENNPVWEPGNQAVGLPLDETTLPDVLKQAGMTTGAVGKWHLGAHPRFHPLRRGFDWYFGLLGGGHDYFLHNVFQTNPNKAQQEYLIPLERNGQQIEESAYLTDALGREAAAFVEQHHTKPFCLYLAFNAPHTPLQAPPKYVDRVTHIKDEKLRKYGAMICGMDDAVGNLLGKLKERGLIDNTLIFFFSDNGGPVGVTHCRNTPLRGAKGDVYEGGVRVPFVVSWPGKFKPGKFEQPVSSLDVFPTAVAACGAKAPAGVKLDGIDLTPHLAGQAESSLGERTLFWRTGGGNKSAIRQGNMKLVRNGQQPAELYDLSADIAESQNLAEKAPDTVKLLQSKLDAWNAELAEPKWAGLAKAKRK